jgi:hypothetical protein
MTQNKVMASAATEEAGVFSTFAFFGRTGQNQVR